MLEAGIRGRWKQRQEEQGSNKRRERSNNELLTKQGLGILSGYILLSAQ